MSLDTLPTIVTLLIALSVAAERLVEIIKSPFGSLDEHKTDPRHEGFRRAGLHLLAAVAGIAISWASWPMVYQVIRSPAQPSTTPPVDVPTVLALGLLASGGSGFWNSMLTYVVSLKELKRADVKERAAGAAAAAIPQPAEGRLVP